jgi:hypothetical protein
MIFVKIPRTASTFFEYNFYNKIINYEGETHRIISVGHSWLYPTKIKGWLDWDNPTQEQGIFRNVLTYGIPPGERIVTIVRNPFDLFLSYYNYNWAWCRKYHKLDHAPALKKSLFSQLKDINGNWVINDSTILLRFENLNEDLDNFCKKCGLVIENRSEQAINSSGKKATDWYRAYTNEQIIKLSKIWESDLEKFKYSHPYK